MYAGLAMSGTRPSGEEDLDDADAVDLGAPPDADALSRAVSRSRVARNLFGVEEHVTIGRYQLLEKVGAGGIGVVWGAWDPELERRVAIKLVRAKRAAARERMLAEGQALARLSHPNIVPVYDVGVFGDEIYLVMEWIAGQDLRSYCKRPRSVREIVAVYRAAGEGLLAAHGAGLIHRDFKPDNAILGDDERVRVIDFGLARGEVAIADAGDAGAPVTRGAGTPRYMAPEQADGTALTPAADQYAFCAALREALVDREGADRRAAVPGWLDVILTRGTSRDPTARYPSMRELLRALGRDPRTVWRRRLLAATVLGIVGAAFVAGSLRASRTTLEPCAGAGPAIARIWNATARDAVAAHLRGLGAYGAAEAPGLDSELTSYGAGWAATFRQTCLAHERHELTDPVYARNIDCLTRLRVSYETVIGVLETAPIARLSSAIVTARGLPAADRCRLQAAASPVPAPAQAIAAQARALAADIERARTLAKSDDPAALEATRMNVIRADRLGYEPLTARAYLAHGLALIGREQAAAAIPVLERAAAAAVDAFDDLSFVEAYAREIYARSVAGPESVGGAEDHRALDAYVERVAQRAGPAGAAARALLFNNLGTSRLAVGDVDGARTWFDRSLAEQGVRDHDPELIGTLANRALVTADPADRDRLFAEARAALTRLLGAYHRKTLDVRLQAAFFIAEPQRAAAELRELCGLYERFQAEVAAGTISACVFELGWLAEERGDRAEARAAMARVRDTEGPLREMADAYRAMLDGKLAEAAAAARRVGERYRSESWEQFDAASAYLLAATCELAGHHSAAAVVDARAALALFEQLSSLSRTANYQRRLARTRALLAGLVAQPEARRLANDALGWYRGAGGYDAVVARLAMLVTAADSH
jgi:hypothetical protein